MDGDGITSLDWDSYPILRFSEVPEIDTEIIHAPDQPTLGMGECTFGRPPRRSAMRSHTRWARASGTCR